VQEDIASNERRAWWAISALFLEPASRICTGR
jgi:hypothetical protein